MKRLWFNGIVVSMDSDMRQYKAIGVENEHIIFLGDNVDALQQAWDEQIDLKGAMILPGFHDTHMHLLNYAMFQKDVALFGIKSIEEIIVLCQERIAQRHPNYLLGIGWDQEIMAEGRMPTRADMDRISTEIPVCTIRSCFHVAVCNTVMLEQIRNLKNSTAEILRYVDFEQGILREDAMRLYREVIPKADRAYIRELFLSGQRALNSAGITCVHSDDLKVLSGVDPLQIIGILREMEAAGELTIRLYEQCLVDEADFQNLQSVRSKPDDHTSLFRTGPRKLLQDGSLGAKSAEMIDGYADNPDNHGIPIHAEEELYRLIKAAHRDRMDVAVHAIGDLALKKVCDAVERVENEDPWPEHRHAVVHAQITTPELLARMRKLGLQVLIQPIFIEADMGVIEDRVGLEHAKTCYNWNSMLKQGLHVSGGSDCPVESFDVLDNLRAAITRENRAGTQVYLPEQALTVEQALRLFTSSAAWVSRDEGIRGTLELGKLADLVVLDQNLLEISPRQFTSVRVLETVLNGRTVYQARQ